MTTTSTDRPNNGLGIVVLGGDIATVSGVARRAEALGFDSAWTTEFYDRSAIVTLAEMSAATTHLRIGSAIAYGVGRSPLVLSAEARDLDEISGGRLILGLGTGTRTMQEDWHGASSEAPATRMEELVPLLREFWSMDASGVHHDGRFFRVKLEPTVAVRPPLRVDIPVYLAGVNKRMIQAAGCVGNGLVGHPLFTDKYVSDIVRPALQVGADIAGRTEQVPIAGFVICAISDDGVSAREEARRQIAFYSVVRSYEPIMKMHGFEEAAAAARAAWARQDIEAMTAAVPDEMLDAIAIAGTADEVRDQLRQRIGNRYEQTLLYSPSFGLSAERFQENLTAILETFGSTEASRAN